METIHLILGKANPQRMNGVNKVVHEMATNQVEQGYPVEVWGITSSRVYDFPKRIFATQLYASFKNPFRPDKVLLSDLLEKKGSIVVHFHGAFIPVFYTISSFLYNHQIPFIITPHSTYNKVMMKKNALVKKIYFRLFERKLLDRASAIHLLGISEWEGLQAIYHNNKSVLIPYGFTLPEPSEKKPVKAPRFTIGYCGRIAIYPKGLDILLNGFAQFHRALPESELLIIGDGKDRSRLEKMAEDLKIREAVVFKGPLFGEDKISKLNQCHVFAHPSRTDGLPATIVEAASLGLPCIVSSATNMGNFIKDFDAGYVMERASPESLCSGLKAMHERINILQEEDQLRKNALRMIGEAFNWTHILQQFQVIYTDALKPNPVTKNNLMMLLKKSHVA
jgi:glycosyltransferase involved in cell wall biosynthesis